jgi:dihydroflavonol-4-reductase
MTNRVLVTGATGFIGTHLVRALTDLGMDVTAMVRAGSDVRGLQRYAHREIRGDLTDPGSLRAAMDGCELVFHCAAVVSYYRRDAEVLRLINVDGTRAMVRAALDARVKRFVHTSTVAAIGHDPAGRPLDESAPYNSGRLRIPYCDTKHEAETIVLEEGVRRGLDAVIVNPSFVFGPGDRRKAAGSYLERVAVRPPLLAPAGGMNVVDVSDVVSGHVLAARKGRTGERYILGGEDLTNRQLLTRICRIIGRRPPRITVPALALRGLATLATWLDPLVGFRPPVTPEVLRILHLHKFYSSEKAARELDYAPYPIDMAIKATYDWMLDSDLLPPGTLRGLGRV